MRATPSSSPSYARLPQHAPRLEDVPEELDEKTLAFAHRVFDLARSGERDALAELVAAGAPANLTNDKGEVSVASSNH